MKVVSIEHNDYFRAGDYSVLTELLHPQRDESLAMKASIAFAKIEPGCVTKKHRLRHSAEIYCIVSGSGLMTIDDEEQYVTTGDVVYIPPGAWQSLHNCGDATIQFYCVVDPAWQELDEEVVE